MMQVLALQAEPAEGGCIQLSWRTPADAAFRGVRVLRRERRFPDLNDLGSSFEVHRDSTTPAGATAGFLDGPLRGETVHYYTVVSTDASEQTFSEYVSALAPAPYDTEAYLFRNLPELYRLFDRGGGQVRRLVGLLAQPLDVVRSTTASLRDLHDVERVDGSLLPLLSEWIGQPTDITRDLDSQRNEIRFAPQFYRTVGIAANVRAGINRYVNWDARLKEFVHNVFLTTHPEQLRIWEMQRRGTLWSSARNLNLDVGHDGRVSALTDRDGRRWALYHARQSAPAASRTSDRSSTVVQDDTHLFAKLEDQGSAAPAVRITFGEGVYKRPSALERPDGSIWVFYTRHVPSAGRLLPRIELQLLALGRAPGPARLVGTLAEPFSVADGDIFEVRLQEGPRLVQRSIVVRRENLPHFPELSATALARVLNAELPRVLVSATDSGQIALQSESADGTTSLALPAATLSAKLGFAIAATSVGVAATTATLTGLRAAPFALSVGDTLTLRIDKAAPRRIVFVAGDFANPAQASAAEVAAAIERALPGVAEVAANRIRLHSRTSGSSSVVSVVVNESSAALALGLGARLPSVADVDDDEPSACVDGSGNIWLFWASRRSGVWKIWYSRSNGVAWDAAKPLTTGDRPDREPFAVFDPSGSRLWVFWTRKLPSGLRNVFSRTTTNLDFPALTDGDWVERENTPSPTTFENREPAAAAVGDGSVELYFASSRVDGWQIWTRTVRVGAQDPEFQLTVGQNTHRAPTPLVLPGEVRLSFRSNQSEAYSSNLYPDAITVDARYSGSTTLDLRNATKLSLRASLKDEQRYTYDTRSSAPEVQPGEQTGWYARNKVGVFLTPDTNDQALIVRQRHLFSNALRRALPIQVELVFLVDQTFTEPVYGYEAQAAGAPSIGEQMVDTILAEVLAGSRDAFEDSAPGVRFLRSWVPGEVSTLSNLAPGSVDLSARLFTKAFREGA